MAKKLALLVLAAIVLGSSASGRNPRGSVSGVPANVGVWINITPSAFTTPSNMQTAGVAVDPTTGYAYSSAGNNTNGGGGSPTATGIYQSTNSGVTWTHVSTGTNSTAINGGLLWDIASDTNGVLYVANGYGNPASIFKSINHGVDFSDLLAGKSFTLTGDSAVSGPVAATTVFNGNPFVQAFSIDPNNNNHIVMTMHQQCFDGVSAGSGGWGIGGSDSGVACFGETTDGGSTWRFFKGPSTLSEWQESATISIISSSAYIFISPAGNSSYTSNGGATWSTAQYTTNGGVSYSNWPDGSYSGYGGNGFIASDGNMYVGLGQTGVVVSTPSGTGGLGSAQNWSLLSGSPNEGGVIISDGISIYSVPSIPIKNVHFSSAPLSNTTNWTTYTAATLSQGCEQFAYDPINHALYAACYSAGLWRLQIR